MNLRALIPLALLCLLGSVASAAVVEPQQLRVEVINRYAHDPSAFTQGLLWNGSTLYESAGLTGQSSLREVSLATGTVLRSRDIESPIFAEGLALIGDRLIQLTWRNGIAIVYDADTFIPLESLPYSGEGWGLCSDGARLIMSNGSATLFFRDPETLEVLSTLPVTLRGAPQPMLNELEFVDGFIYANIWMDDRILKIDSDTGIVVAEIDASGLLTPAEAADADVLNGIAFLPSTAHFLITGKLWPWVFEVEFVPTDEMNGIVLGGSTTTAESASVSPPLEN